jgi:hypothetical protein
MAYNEYSATASSVRPYKLTQKQLLGIGRLIRACAEIEDITTLHMCELADITEGQSLVFLGRAARSQKLRIAETFAKARGGKTAEAFASCFDNDEYRAIIRCRNAVAHGLLLGLTDQNKIAFRVADVVGTDGLTISILVNSFEKHSFETFAKMAEDAIPQLERILGLGALRQKRRELGLDPHRKAPPQGKQSAKSPPQPQSSQAMARRAKLDRKAAQRKDPKNRKKNG